MFADAARTLELVNMDEVHTLAETMFADLPEAEKGKELERLKEIDNKRATGIAKVNEGRKKFQIAAK